jgi:histidinol phosphatase-like enzyme (inositol monophosphatase family)
MLSNNQRDQRTGRNSSLSSVQIEEIKDFMNFLAEESSKIISKYFDSELNIATKSDETPVTRADLETEELLRKLISEKFPEHGIIGEEFEETNKLAKFKWVIDPIDGTKSFINGSYDFGTLVALLEDGYPIVGMFSQPILKEVIIGDGLTTRCNGKIVKVKDATAISDCGLLITYISALEDAGCLELSKKTKYTKTWGNCFSYSLLAKGYPVIVVDPKMDIYDFMALVPIINGAGGRITDLHGREPNLSTTSIVASSQLIHENVINTLNLKRLNQMKIAIIIDGYSTGRNYVKKFTALDYTCIHVQSSNNLPQFILDELDKNLYAKTIVNNELEMTINEINSMGTPTVIIPGSDTGILLADKLADAYKLETANVPELSLARRDKYVMGETIRAAGIRAIKQIQSANIDEALVWIESQQLQYPIVVKPLKSGSGEGFCLCKDAKDVRDAFELHLGKLDLFNQINDVMLVQECIKGTEYVVNTVSRDGKHFVSEICLHNKVITKNGHSIYISTDFLPLDHECAGMLSEYMTKVLTALGVKYGPGHGEVFIDEKGPVLVEVGCRPMGSSLDPQIVTDSYGHNHIDMTVAAYTLSEEEFNGLCSDFNKKVAVPLSIAYMTSLDNGEVIKFNDEPLLDLESCKKVDVYVKPGQQIVVARNLDDSICMLYLQHPNKEVIRQDMQKLRTFEETRLVLTVKPAIAQLRMASEMKDDFSSSTQVVGMGLFATKGQQSSVPSTAAQEIFKNFLTLPESEKMKSLGELSTLLSSEGIDLVITRQAELTRK